MATAATVFRDYETDGVPSSGARKPKKSEIRQLLGGYEAIINAFLSNGGLIFASKASLDASLNYAANTMAWVLGDATVANNGIYRKIGGTGTGSWTRVSDLPFSFIIASDVGAGTANAIQATTSIPVSSSALVWMNVFEANTASPVTVSFNGATALTIKTNTGNNIAASGLVAGMIVLGIVSGANFRLVSDQASAAIAAAAEASANAAAASATAASNSAAAAAASEAAVAAFASNALRVDVAQSFDATKRAQGRSNLGLGGAAVLNVGVTSGTVAAGDDSRIVNAAQLVGGVLQNSNLPTRLRDSATAATVADCNLAIASGRHYADGTAINRPSTGDTFWLDVVGNNTNFIFQRAIGLNSGGIWIRRNISGVWGAWIRDYGAQSGRAIGNSLIYEDFGGFPTLFTDNRMILRKQTPTNADVYNVAVIRAAPAGGTVGFVNNALRVETTVDGVTTAYEWAFLASLYVNAAGGGEHCAAYSRAEKNANGTAWAHCMEARDNVIDPTTGTLGIELGMFIKGTDTNGMRHALDISIGSTDSLAGTNIVTTAIRIGPTTGDATRAQLVNGIQIKGRVGTGIDLSLLDIAYSTTTFRMPTNGIISWRDNNQTLRGDIGWNSSINTWQISGVLNATSATAGGATALPATPQGYMHFQLNGTMRKVPYYAA